MDIQWDVALVCVRVVFLTSEVNRDVKEIDREVVSFDYDL